MGSCESGIWSWPTWVFWLRFSHQVADKASAGAVISSEGWTVISSEGGTTSKLTHVIFGRLQFLPGYWTEDLKSLLADTRGSLISLPHGLSISERVR